MKAYLINMHLLVPRSRSSAKVRVNYKGYISQKMAVSGAFLFHKHILLPSVLKNILVLLRRFKLGLFQTIPGFHNPEEEGFLKHCRKREKHAVNHLFLLFSRCPIRELKLDFTNVEFVASRYLNLELCKICF